MRIRINLFKSKTSSEASPKRAWRIPHPGYMLEDFVAWLWNKMRRQTETLVQGLCTFRKHLREKRAELRLWRIKRLNRRYLKEEAREAARKKRAEANALYWASFRKCVQEDVRQAWKTLRELASDWQKGVVYIGRKIFDWSTNWTTRQERLWRIYVRKLKRTRGLPEWWSSLNLKKWLKFVSLLVILGFASFTLGFLPSISLNQTLGWGLVVLVSAIIVVASIAAYKKFSSTIPPTERPPATPATTPTVQTKWLRPVVTTALVTLVVFLAGYGAYKYQATEIRYPEPKTVTLKSADSFVIVVEADQGVHGWTDTRVVKERWEQQGTAQHLILTASEDTEIKYRVFSCTPQTPCTGPRPKI